MDSLGHKSQEIERLYDELDICRCECKRPDPVVDSCDFHQKLTRLTHLQDKELEVIERGFRQFRSSISKTFSVLEEMDVGLRNVLK